MRGRIGKRPVGSGVVGKGGSEGWDLLLPTFWHKQPKDTIAQTENKKQFHQQTIPDTKREPYIVHVHIRDGAIDNRYP